MGHVFGNVIGWVRQRSILWLGGAVVGLAFAGLSPVPLHGQPSSSAVPRVALAPRQPPVLPGSTTEQVLALSLEEAIRLALFYNLDIERERFGPLIAHTDVEQARAVYDPTVGVGGNISQTKTLPLNQSVQFDRDGNPIGVSIIRPFTKHSEFGPFLNQRIFTGANYEIRFLNTRDNVAPAGSGTNRRIVDPRYESLIELTFTQPLLRDFGIAVNTAQIRQAQQAEAIAVQQVLQTILDTVFAVQQGYWDLVFRYQDLAARRESRKLAEDFLAENKIRVELGTLAPIELVQAATQAKTREGEVIVAEAAVTTAADRLKEVLNLPETRGTWRIRLLPTEDPAFAPVENVSVEEKIALALQHRPDFVQSQLGITSREIARELAQNQKLPRLDVEGRAGVSGFGGDLGESIPNIVDGDGYQWVLGLRFAYPLGNRFARNELEKRKLELQQARVDQRRLLRTIGLQIRQAARDIETASKRVEVTRAATALARTQLEAEQEKFRLGLSTSFNVLEFQADLTTARSEETRALSDYNTALARLDQVTGIMQYGLK